MGKNSGMGVWAFYGHPKFWYFQKHAFFVHFYLIFSRQIIALLFTKKQPFRIVSIFKSLFEEKNVY